MIFNRGFIKFIAALAIPGGIIWWFISAQQQANQEVEQYKKEQQEHPTSQNVVIDNYELKEVDDHNQIRWQLKAKRGTIETKSQVVLLEHIRIEYYDGPALKMRLTAPTG